MSPGPSVATWAAAPTVCTVLVTYSDDLKDKRTQWLSAIFSGCRTDRGVKHGTGNYYRNDIWYIFQFKLLEIKFCFICSRKKCRWIKEVTIEKYVGHLNWQVNDICRTLKKLSVKSTDSGKISKTQNNTEKSGILRFAETNFWFRNSSHAKITHLYNVWLSTCLRLEKSKTKKINKFYTFFTYHDETESAMSQSTY